MALDLALIVKSDSGFNTAVPTIHSNVSADNKAATAAADYYLTYKDKLKIGDLIYVFASDGGQGLQVATLTASTVTTVILF